MDRRFLAACFLALIAVTAVSVANSADSAVDAPAPPGFKPKDHAEKFQFQAEVNRLMDIIINSLYSNMDIFLRELISNASDALDKIRFLSLADPTLLGEGDQTKLEIRISVDKENKILKLRDTGIGMTKDDLIKNLGTIAKSGTSAFLEKMQKEGDMNLIGQFGVGFYSVYLVADYVEVTTKHNEDKQWVWESSADGNFAISEDTEGEPLGRGTEIKIHLKEEAQEYLDQDKLKALVEKYSEFINFPIYLYTTKEVDVEVEAEEDETEKAAEEESADDDKTAEDEASDDDVEDDTEEEEEGGEEDKPKTKTVKEMRSDWELLNDQKALWLRNPSDIDEDEYHAFYKTISKGEATPLAYTHFKAEGDVEFRAIMFIPATAPYDFFDTYYSRKPDLKLYVRRVFISDEFDELLPKYLTFLRGLVDSDTLPLNVSREMLQAHSSLKTIRKKLVRKALDMIRRLADADKKAADPDSDLDEGERAKLSAEDKFRTFYKQFGKALKLGVIEDSQNRQRLAALLRFETSKSDGELIPLETYVARMKEGQKDIYYLTGATREEVAKSPFLEQLVSKDYEVVYMYDAVDEYMMHNLKEFEDTPFQNASKEDLKFGDKDKKAEKKLRAEYKNVTTWWKDTLGAGTVDAVKLSKRLATTPCVVVTSKYGWSANMERIMRAQALSETDKQGYQRGGKTLEINPRHPLVKELKAKYEADKEAEGTKALARLLFDTALVESGFAIEDPKAFNGRVYALMQQVLGIQGDIHAVDPEPQPGSGPDPDDAEDGAAEDTEDADEGVHEFDFSKISAGMADAAGGDKEDLMDLDLSPEDVTIEKDEL